MKNWSRFVAPLSIGGTMLVAGCASIMSGRAQEVSFRSNPDGATVTISGRIIGKTPITTMLKKSSGQTMIFEKEGYKPLTMSLETRMNGWFWGNIVIGGLLGSSTDGITGAVREYSPSQYMVTLEPISAGPLEKDTARPQQQKAKDFIVSGYRDIIKDLHAGKGEYLASLLNMLKIQEENRDEAVKMIRALSQVYSDIPEFADKVIELYLK